jgi:hypothetical protein
MAKVYPSKVSVESETAQTPGFLGCRSLTSGDRRAKMGVKVDIQSYVVTTIVILPSVVSDSIAFANESSGIDSRG